MSGKQDSDDRSIPLTTLLWIIRKTYPGPGGGRLGHYHEGYDQAMRDVRKLIREEIQKLKDSEKHGKRTKNKTAQGKN